METFSCMKVVDLKAYLRARGVVVGQEGHQELAERAYWANKLGLREKISDRAAELKIDSEKSEKLILDGGMVRLPRPESCKYGWEATPTSVPDTTRGHIDRYIRAAGRKMGLDTHSVKTLGLGKGLHMSHHVQDVCYHGICPNISYCFVRARVIPQTSTNAERYYTWVVLNKDNGEIITAECNCTIGIQGGCKHITALLFTVAEAVEEERNMSSTSQKMAWGVQKVRKHDGGAKHIQDIKIIKVKPDTSIQKTDEDQGRVYRSRYDPRAVAYRVRRPVSGFDLDRLADITGGKTGLLMYNKPKEDLGRQIPNINYIDTEEEVSTTIEAPTIENTISYSNLPEADRIMENLKITHHQQVSLASSTATQASNPKWHQHRKGRITASVAAECAAKVTDNKITPGHSCVAKIMGYYGTVTSPALQWGRDMESIAKRQYIANHKINHKHRSVSLQETGLWISLQHPFLAGSPDGIVFCKECEGGQPGLLEVKNPYSNRHSSIIDLTQTKASSGLKMENGIVSLDHHHKYYTQIQIQLHSSQHNWCDFVVRTVSSTNNFHVERIYIDHIYLSHLFPKLEYFFMNAIVPEYKTRQIQDLIITNGVKETMNRILDKLDSGIPSANAALVAYPCGVCWQNCASNPNKDGQSIGCDECQKWFHYKCLGLTGSERFLRKRKSTWKCQDCTSRKQRKK